MQGRAYQLIVQWKKSPLKKYIIGSIVQTKQVIFRNMYAIPISEKSSHEFDGEQRRNGLGEGRNAIEL